MKASAIIPTAGRAPVLRRTLESVFAQDTHPAELIVIDASADSSTREVCKLFPTVTYLAAVERGAAQQRVQGVAHSDPNNDLLFLDDDILLEPYCLTRLASALASSDRIGGVSATITNQQFSPPGRLTRFVLNLIDPEAGGSYPGRRMAGILPQLPQDSDDLPEVVPVEWLNLGCTLYRRGALPQDLFPRKFFGASTAEDLALSLEVARSWLLANARTARIFHDSQGGAHKRSAALLAKMELVNRHHIMTSILGQRSLRSHLNLLVAQAFTLAGTLRQPGGLKHFPARLCGKFRALGLIAIGRP